MGIPQSKRRAIFREFHRLDEGAKVARGLGLGLSIVERIGRILDHKVEMRSAVGTGSRFSVEVPLSTAKVAASHPQRQATGLDPTQLAGLTVLCIDNDHQILDGMGALLGGWGCRVFQAAGLAEADACLDEAGTVPTGILVDYHLDSGTGIDAIAALRRRYGADLPAILITADRSPLVRDEARRHDVVLLNKPVKPAALRALLAQWRLQRVAAE
jgi:CheY-like chemotaxis protein